VVAHRRFVADADSGRGDIVEITSGVAPLPRRLGVRALGRLEKQRRVAEAAEAVFREFGYQDAAVRTIAARAGVSIGTVFEFAPDKRSLLLLIFGGVLDRLTDGAIATLDRDASLLDQFMHIFRERYRFFHDEIDLARNLIVEFGFFPKPTLPDSPVAQYLATRAAFRERIAQVVAEQQRRRRIDSAIDPHDITSIAIAINLIEFREWLAEETPSVEQGLCRLRKMLRIALCGVLLENDTAALQQQ
jgi:AcrR family transcriptional regulator